MSNIVKKIVFPLAKSYYTPNTVNPSTYFKGVFYATIALNELKRLVKISHEKDIGVFANNNIRIYRNTIFAEAKPVPTYPDFSGTEVRRSESHIAVNFNWLLNQAEIVEKGIKCTKYCLLSNDSLVVLNTEKHLEKYSCIPSSILILELAETLQELLDNNNSSSVWEYFIGFIFIDKQKSCRISLTDEAKQLIVKMRLRDMQDTVVYHTLQGISDAVDASNKAKHNISPLNKVFYAIT